MSRNTISGLIVLAVLIVCSWFYYYASQFAPKHDWVESYNEQSEEPYGLSVLYELLKEREAGVTILNNGLSVQIAEKTMGSNYMYFGYSYDKSVSQIEEMLEYVKDGNSAFIFTNDNPYSLLGYLINPEYTRGYYDYREDSVVFSNYYGELGVDSGYTFHYQVLDEKRVRYWHCITASYFQDTLMAEGCIPLSYLEDEHVNFYYLNHGEGRVYIHANPILFANYNIAQTQGFDYATRALSFMESGKVFWDNTAFGNDDQAGNPEVNPLKFLFSHYTLKWGWYCLLGMIILYLLFRAKREQRIIPIPLANPNSSIEFTKAVGILYFQQGNHKMIAEEQYELFLYKVRSRYNIPNNIEEKELKKQLLLRSGVHEQVVDDLFDSFFKLRFNPIAKSEDLERLYLALKQFYEKRK